MSACVILVPNGSLHERCLLYLDRSGYDVHEPDSGGRCGSSRDGRVEFLVRDRRMIPHLVARGRYDAGVTGLDLLLQSREEGLRRIAKLCFAKRTDRPTRWVLAARGQFDLRGVRIGCELECLPQLVLPSRFGPPAAYEVVKLEGDEESAIEDGLCDMILVVTETGRAIREQGLEIVPGCENLLESSPMIIAKPTLPSEKEESLRRVAFALEAAIGAATRRMMKFDLPRASLTTLQLPAEVAPTVSDLVAREGWVAVEICVPRWEVDSIGLRARDAGARAIVVQEVIGFSSGNF